MKAGDDIFSTITRYNSPENRFTASLMYLLDYLWRESEGDDGQRKALCDLLSELCGPEVRFSPTDQLSFEAQKGEKTKSKDGLTLDLYRSAQQTCSYG